MSSSDAPEQTARDRLKAFREEFSIALASSMSRHKVGDGRFAELCGATRQKVGLWRDPEVVEAPSLPHVILGPRAVAKDMLALAAGKLGLVISEAMSFETVRDHLDHLHRVIESTSLVNATYSGALRDKTICTEERRAIIAVIKRAISDLTALLHDLEGEEAAHLAAVQRRPSSPALKAVGQ